MFNTNGIDKTTLMMNYALPKIKIYMKALCKMEAYTANCDTEIGWQGFARFDRENNVIYIDDVFLPEQKANGSTCEFSPNAQSVIIQELLSNTETAIRINDIRVWGHSHVRMSTGPSSQDEKQLRSFVSPERCSYYVGIITNKNRDLSCYYVDPYVYARFVPWDIYNPDVFNENEIIDEIAAKVKIMTYPVESAKNPNTWNGEKIIVINDNKKKSPKSIALQEVIENIDKINTKEEINFDELLDFLDKSNDKRDLGVLEDSISRLIEIVAEVFCPIDFSYITDSEFFMDISKLLSMGEFSKERNMTISNISVAWDDMAMSTSQIEAFINEISRNEEFLTLFNYLMIIVARQYSTILPIEDKSTIIKGENIKKPKVKEKKGDKKNGLLKTKRDIR